jgi:hypothetical protein
MLGEIRYKYMYYPFFNQVLTQHRINISSKMVKTIPFNDNLQVPSPGFGAMGLSFGLGTNLTYEQAEPVLLKAVDLGCTFWDTAVFYALL